jgi:hypothetical protein
MRGTISLIQELEKPIQGYWDGGPKKYFEWKIEHIHRLNHPRRKGPRVRVGSWDANYWFYVVEGRTDKQTLGGI